MAEKKSRKIGEQYQRLPVPLTEEELLDRGQRLAAVESDFRSHEAHSDSVKKQLKAREAELLSRQSELASQIRNKAEPRDVLVELIATHGSGEVALVRQDTGGGAVHTRVDRRGAGAGASVGSGLKTET